MSQNMTKQTAAHGSTTAHSNNQPINQPINTYLYLDDMKYMKSTYCYVFILFLVLCCEIKWVLETFERNLRT